MAGSNAPVASLVVAGIHAPLAVDLLGAQDLVVRQVLEVHPAGVAVLAARGVESRDGVLGEGDVAGAFDQAAEGTGVAVVEVGLVTAHGGLAGGADRGFGVLVGSAGRREEAFHGLDVRLGGTSVAKHAQRKGVSGVRGKSDW